MTLSSASFRVRIWDLPTRAFHILLVLCVVGLVVTGEVGGSAMPFHFWLGYAVFALVLFRLVWGFVGGHWSRFAHFVPTPSRLMGYVKSVHLKRPMHSVGHNPLGALSVLGMLCLLFLQVISGLMSDDEIANTGPWVALIPSEWVGWATEYHTEIGKLFLILLICLHVATVLYYKHFKRDDLITPMLTGDKVLDHEVPASRDTWTARTFALSVFLGCAYAVYRMINLSI